MKTWVIVLIVVVVLGAVGLIITAIVGAGFFAAFKKAGYDLSDQEQLAAMKEYAGELEDAGDEEEGYLKSSNPDYQFKFSPTVSVDGDLDFLLSVDDKDNEPILMTGELDIKVWQNECLLYVAATCDSRCVKEDSRLIVSEVVPIEESDYDNIYSNYDKPYAVGPKFMKALKTFNYNENYVPEKNWMADFGCFEATFTNSDGDVFEAYNPEFLLLKIS